MKSSKQTKKESENILKDQKKTGTGKKQAKK